MPGPAPPKSQDVFFKYKEILDKERRLFDIQNGTMSKIEVDPVILKEIIYPIDPPSEKAVMFLEACFSAYNEGRIVFALKNLEETINEYDSAITALDNVFFHFLRASILESACRDDLALAAYEKSYIASKRYAPLTSIPINHPDRALPMMGFGSVLYNSGEYELAARSFIAVRPADAGQRNSRERTRTGHRRHCHLLQQPRLLPHQARAQNRGLQTHHPRRSDPGRRARHFPRKDARGQTQQRESRCRGPGPDGELQTDVAVLLRRQDVQDRQGRSQPAEAREESRRQEEVSGL